MDIESKIWTYAGTGTKVHAFIDGVALCRKNLRNDPARVERMGHDYAGAVYYASVCSNCRAKFNAAIEREEAHQARLASSMAPSTGEGDYLPPAQEGRCCDHASSHHGGRGCDECPCATPRTGAQQDSTEPTVTNEKEDEPMPGSPQSGPLTDRQKILIGHIRSGMRYREAAKVMSMTEVALRREVVNITRKFKVSTITQAITHYSTAAAFREAAHVLDHASRSHPERDGVAENHADHVLRAIAAELRTRADHLMPRA